MDRICKERWINVPNLLTILRIALIPLVSWCFLQGDSKGALALYLISMLTDIMDGFIARRLNQITALGKLLDPIADKLCLLTLTGLFVMDGQIPLWALAIILAKESLLVIGSAAALRHGIVVYALPIGKVTTMSFVLSIVARFTGWRDTADVLLGMSIVLSIAALMWYGMVMLLRMQALRTEAAIAN